MFTRPSLWLNAGPTCVCTVVIVTTFASLIIFTKQLKAIIKVSVYTFHVH